MRRVSLLVARNLWRFYGATPAVRGMDLEVDKGSAYGFIGPNGAGKSTTLRILATADRPDAGRVLIDGQDASRHPDRARRRIGFMPDPFSLYDDVTVEGFLAFFANAYAIPPRQQRAAVDRAIELARVGERRRQTCGGLSKGWRQRVLLAKTLVHDPSVLLLDEPASGLDPAARIEFREIVKALRDLGKAIVVSSHILTELADFCDAVGIVERGRMLVSGRIADILTRLEAHDVLELEVLGDGQRARAVAAAVPGVKAVRDAPDSVDKGADAGAEAAPTTTLLLDLAGRSTPADRAALLRALAAGGVEASGLAQRREGLEQLFLRVAEGARGDLRALVGGPAATKGRP
jgi:ABC-2 type transport system ATP-binding protein